MPRGMPPGPPMNARGGQNMMRQLQEMQERMLLEQQALGTATVEVSVGGGAVKIVMNGHQKVLEVSIDPQLLDPDEVDMLSDLILTAVNQAVERSQAMAHARMSDVTKGMQLPPGFGI
ncbi:MAG: YbaB/EbfC family nucleoid-associated protein [Ardenticatenales bacterium]